MGVEIRRRNEFIWNLESVWCRGESLSFRRVGVVGIGGRRFIGI